MRAAVKTNDDVSSVAGDPRTAEYRPSWGGLPTWWGSTGGYSWLQFSLHQVEPMLDDPVVALGTSIIETPIIRHEKQWQVLGDDAEIIKYVDRCYRTLWRRTIRQALYCVRFGYSSLEALYDFDHNQDLQFTGTKPLHPIDTEPGLDPQTGMLGGFIIKSSWGAAGSGTNKEVPRQLLGADDNKPAKGLWFFYGSEFNGHRGRSRFRSAFPPWREKNGTDGTLDIIRMWYYKNAYAGLVVTYPEKMMNVSGRGMLPARDMARQIAETLKTGGVASIPSTVDPRTGKPLWDIQWPKMNGSAEGLLDYKRVNDEDILRGLLIPDDVITGSGGGYSGRKVSEDAFYTMEEDLLHRCVWPFDASVVRPLVEYNFGPGDKYQVVWQPMLPARQQLDAQQQNGAAGMRQGGGNPQAQGGLAQALLGGSAELPPGGEEGQAQAPENRQAQVGLSLQYVSRPKKPVRRRRLVA